MQWMAVRVPDRSEIGDGDKRPCLLVSLVKMKFINLSFEKHLHLLWSSGNFSPVVT